jgi:hypothetical protein
MSSLAATLATIAHEEPSLATLSPLRFIAEQWRGRCGTPLRIPRCHAGACHAVAFGPSGPLCWPCHDWLRRFMERLMKREEAER